MRVMSGLKRSLGLAIAAALISGSFSVVCAQDTTGTCNDAPASKKERTERQLQATYHVMSGSEQLANALDKDIKDQAMRQMLGSVLQAPLQAHVTYDAQPQPQKFAQLMADDPQVH